MELNTNKSKAILMNGNEEEKSIGQITCNGNNLVAVSS